MAIAAASSESRIRAEWPRAAAWLPLAILPVATTWFAAEWPAWAFMWALAFSMYAALKWLSFAHGVDHAQTTIARSLGYLLLWPGMDAKSFLAARRDVSRPSRREWLFALLKVALGVLLVFVAVSLVHKSPMIAGWIGMVGIVFTLHFGLFHVLSAVWRRAGVDAPPIMSAPILASSLADFWGKRWNLAFRDLAHAYVFRPFVGRWGIAAATLAVFLASGVVHDAVISIPARGGYGLPTLYFAIQGVGVLVERSRLGRRIGLRSGTIGRAYCAAVALAPVGLLFHVPFVDRVVVPMLAALGS